MATALVTGASSGIGLELAKVLAREKMDLILVARSLDKLEELKKELSPLGPKISVISHDLSTPGSALELYKKTQSLGLNVDCLVNNAGFGEFGEFFKIDRQRQTDMIHLNITSLTELSHLYLPSMLQKKSGHIVNIASTAAFQPGPLMAVYFATKAYVLSFSEALSEELNGTGVSVTTICPGPTESGFLAAAHLESADLFKRSNIPTSKEVAEFTFKAMQNKDVVAVHGWGNWLLAQSNRLAPRSVVRKITKRVLKRN
ncbi:SDR family oxidoreductase [bacterium]|nr:SDR family oxidoreductase [bacterium]